MSLRRGICSGAMGLMRLDLPGGKSVSAFFEYICDTDWGLCNPQIDQIETVGQTELDGCIVLFLQNVKINSSQSTSSAETVDFRLKSTRMSGSQPLSALRSRSPSFWPKLTVAAPPAPETRRPSGAERPEKWGRATVENPCDRRAKSELDTRNMSTRFVFI